MRGTFIDELVIQARHNKQIFLLVGDLGYSVVEQFAVEFPDRFLNVGIAEQNMAGIAAGLASEGYHVFTYSIGNFNTLRCLEQIRNDICYQDFSVTTVSVGAGFSYGSLGYSHHAIQDYGIMRTLGNIEIFSPSDAAESRMIVKWLINNPKPSYLRLEKDLKISMEYIVPDGSFLNQKCYGKSDICILSYGTLVSKITDLINNYNLDVSLFSLCKLHAIESSVLETLDCYETIIIVEEQLEVASLGFYIKNLLSKNKRIYCLNAKEKNIQTVGSQNYIRTINGINEESILSLIKSFD